MQKVRALTNFDGHLKGAEVELPPEYAKAVIGKGLAEEVGNRTHKAAPEASNKMADAPANKGGRGRRNQDNDE